MDPPGGVVGGLAPPNWGPDPSWGGAGGVEIFTKMCKKTNVLLKNEGKIVIQATFIEQYDKWCI